MTLQPADYTASGRALSFIEDYLRTEVLPLYANTHTLTSVTGKQSTLFRQEAREIVLRCVRASKDDTVLFTGSGTTAAVHTLVHVLNLPQYFRQDRQVVVYLGPYEHHSNMLPWREAGCTTIHIKEDAVNGGVDMTDLQLQLEKYPDAFKIGSFGAASNVSGIITDDIAVTELLHKHGALAFWDYASAAPYVDVDMNPHNRDSLSKDAVFISPHKLVGGVNTPGVLVIKKKLLRNTVPSTPGGGTVFFVSPNSHRYLENFEEREEGGTPNIVGCIRTGLVFQLKEQVGAQTIADREHRYVSKAVEAWKAHPSMAIMGHPNPKQRLAIVSFLVRFKDSKLFLHPSFVSALLNDLFGIQSRSGCLCAGPYGQGVMGIDQKTADAFEATLLEKNELLRPGFVRVNFNYFIGEDEAQYIIDAVLFVAEHGWKLLPAYGFFVDSGEWKHRSRLNKVVDRRWLGNISYKSGRMTFPAMQRTTDKPLKFYMDQAMDAVNKAVAGYKSDMVDQGQFLSDSAKRLRWFLLPSEALRLIKKGDKAVQTFLSTQKVLPVPVCPPENGCLDLSGEYTTAGKVAVSVVEFTPRAGEASMEVSSSSSIIKADAAASSSSSSVNGAGKKSESSSSSSSSSNISSTSDSERANAWEAEAEADAEGIEEELWADEGDGRGEGAVGLFGLEKLFPWRPKLVCIGTDVNAKEIENARHNAQQAFQQYGWEARDCGAKLPSRGTLTAAAATHSSGREAVLAFAQGDFDQVERSVPLGVSSIHQPFGWRRIENFVRFAFFLPFSPVFFKIWFLLFACCLVQATIVSNLPHGLRVGFQDAQGSEENMHKALKRFGKMLLRRPDLTNVVVLCRAKQTGDLRKAMPLEPVSTTAPVQRFPLVPKRNKALQWALVSKLNNQGVKCHLLRLVRGGPELEQEEDDVSDEE